MIFELKIWEYECLINRYEYFLNKRSYLDLGLDFESLVDGSLLPAAKNDESLVFSQPMDGLPSLDLAVVIKKSKKKSVKS